MKVRNAETQEKSVKLEKKKADLQKKLGIHPSQLNVQFDDPAKEKQYKLDMKAKGLTAKAFRLQKAGQAKIAAGQKILAKQQQNAHEQQQAIAASLITKDTSKMVNGKVKTIHPNPDAHIAAAKKEGAEIAGELTSAVKDVKEGEKDLKKAKAMLKQAGGVAEGKEPPKPQVPHMP